MGSGLGEIAVEVGLCASKFREVAGSVTESGLVGPWQYHEAAPENVPVTDLLCGPGARGLIPVETSSEEDGRPRFGGLYDVEGGFPLGIRGESTRGDLRFRGTGQEKGQKRGNDRSDERRNLARRAFPASTAGFIGIPPCLHQY